MESDGETRWNLTRISISHFAAAIDSLNSAARVARHNDDTLVSSSTKLVKTLTVLRQENECLSRGAAKHNSYYYYLFFFFRCHAGKRVASAKWYRTNAGILRRISPWFINLLFSTGPSSPPTRLSESARGKDLSSFVAGQHYLPGEKEGDPGNRAATKEGDGGNSVIVSSLSARLMRLPFPAVNFSGR